MRFKYQIDIIKNFALKHSLEVDWPMRNKTTEFAAAATIDVMILASFSLS